MESYCNMNSSNGRNYRNQMNRGYRQNEMQYVDASRHRMQDGNRRNMENGRSYNVSRNMNCDKNDPMEKLGNQFPLVMAYVPWQQWGDLYEASQGLAQGTIFKDLNQIFCGVRC